MKTQLKTDTYEITLTDIDNETVSFDAKLSLAYLLTTKSGIDDPTETTEFFNNFSHDYNGNVFDFVNIGFSADETLNYGVRYDYAGSDFCDDFDDCISAFGKPIIDFIDAHCKLLNIPFYPNR
jgi:hypothetical protein